MQTLRTPIRFIGTLVLVSVSSFVGGVVGVTWLADDVDAVPGRMTAAVPMMSEAEVAAMAEADVASDLATTAITPVRILDTRPGAAALAGSKEPWQPLESRTVSAAGLGVIPADSVGVVVNVTALNATAPDTFLTLYPTGATQPNASTINPVPGVVSFNAATVMLGDAGTFEIYNYSGTVDVIIDVTAFMTRTLAEAVDDVEGDLDAVGADVDVVESKLDDVEGDLDAVGADVDVVESELGDVESDLDLVESDLQQLRREQLPASNPPTEIRVRTEFVSPTWTTVSSEALQGASCQGTRYCSPTVLVRPDRYTSPQIGFASTVKTEAREWMDELCLRLRAVDGEPVAGTETCVDTAVATADGASGVWRYYEMTSDLVAVASLSNRYYLEFTLDSPRTLGDGTPFAASDFRIVEWQMVIDSSVTSSDS